jgi:hypothetical protein
LNLACRQIQLGHLDKTPKENNLVTRKVELSLKELQGEEWQLPGCCAHALLFYCPLSPKEPSTDSNSSTSTEVDIHCTVSRYFPKKRQGGSRKRTWRIKMVSLTVRCKHELVLCTHSSRF